MSNSNYTKVSDKLVAKYGIKVAYVYAKLTYRMNLSHKDKKHYFDNGYFEIYKINDLKQDCHLGRNSIINILGKLEHAHLIKRVHTMFAQKIYLPKFNNHLAKSDNQNQQSSKSKLSKQLKYNNQDSNNSVSVSSSTVKKTKKYPSVTKIIQKYGKRLYQYAIEIFHNENDSHLAEIHSPYHFVIGILRRWAYKGIKTVNDAMKSEHDGRAKYFSGNGPRIPIFRI